MPALLACLWERECALARQGKLTALCRLLCVHTHKKKLVRGRERQEGSAVQAVAPTRTRMHTHT